MPRQKHSPASFPDRNLDPHNQAGGPGLQNRPHLPPGQGGPPDQFFPGNRGPPPGQQGQHPHPHPHLNSGGSPFGPGPGMPPPHSQLNHDFLDDLIQPVTSGIDMGGPPDGHFGPGSNHMFDNSPPFTSQSFPVSSQPGGPHSMANRMTGPPGPGIQSGPIITGTGKMYPPNQSMVFNPSNPNAPPIYPCGVCHKEVHDNDQAILCESGCNFWFHRACTGLSEPAFIMLKEEVYAEWVCDKCLQSKNIPVVKMKP